MKISKQLLIIPPLLAMAGCVHRERWAYFDDSLYAPPPAGRTESHSTRPDIFPPAKTVSSGAIAHPIVSEPQSIELVNHIWNNVMNDPLTAGLSPSLRVSDTRGAITLSGNVESEAQKKKVESLARETPGVVSVANNLQVSGSAVAGLNPDRTLALTSRDQTGPATDMDTGGPLTPTSTRDLGDNMRGESDANQLSAGQTGPVTVNVQGSSESDRNLAQQISQELRADASLASAISQVSISVIDGRVTLRGTVRNEVQKREIESAIERATGVSSVDNQLRVSSTGTPATP